MCYCPEYLFWVYKPMNLCLSSLRRSSFVIFFYGSIFCCFIIFITKPPHFFSKMSKYKIIFFIIYMINLDAKLHLVPKRCRFLLLAVELDFNDFDIFAEIAFLD